MDVQIIFLLFFFTVVVFNLFTFEHFCSPLPQLIAILNTRKLSMLGNHKN